MTKLQMVADKVKTIDYKFKHYFLSEEVEEISIQDQMWAYGMAFTPLAILITSIFIVF